MRALRRIRPLGLAVLIGAVATIAIAQLAMFLPPGNAWYGPKLDQDLGLWMDGDNKIWTITRGASPWHRTTSYWHMQASGLSLMIPAADYEARKFDFRQLPRRQRPASLEELTMLAWFHEVGWPFKALSCSVRWQRQISNANIIYTVRGGVQLPRDADFNPRALPLTPIWAGLLADVAIFGGLWLLGAWSVRAARRRWRMRRLRCAHCGYSVVGLPPGAACPECGR
ncbi:MAG: hypothetical protein ACF8R7_06940 [Phycisphaerales bacterium JB039]